MPNKSVIVSPCCRTAESEVSVPSKSCVAEPIALAQTWRTSFLLSPKTLARGSGLALIREGATRNYRRSCPMDIVDVRMPARRLQLFSNDVAPPRGDGPRGEPPRCAPPPPRSRASTWPLCSALGLCAPFRCFRGSGGGGWLADTCLRPRL